MGIEEGSITVSGIEIVDGGVYLAQDKDTDSTKVLRKIMVSLITESSYKIIDSDSQESKWYLKEAVISNLIDFNEYQHVYKVIERLE
jgi:hypothetical protein